MLEIYINDKEISVSNDCGPWYAEKLSNSWLWVLNVIKNGVRVKIIDNRKEIKSWQTNMDCVRGITKTNHVLLQELLKTFSPISRGIVYENEARYIDDMLLLTDRTTLDLRNLRDFVVASMGGSDDIEDWDRMSAITHCIDMELFSRGAEV